MTRQQRQQSSTTSPFKEQNADHQVTIPVISPSLPESAAAGERNYVGEGANSESSRVSDHLRIWQKSWLHPGLGLVLGVYLFLAFSYFFIVPIFEAPDEWTHTGHVKYIAEGNGLPVMLPGRGIWGGQQPPLYYTIGALLAQPFELATFEAYLETHLNPHASAGYALDPGNKNNYLHSQEEAFPYRGLSLTVHILRLYSMTLGVITLISSYLTAFELAKGQAWFATTVALFVACQPMFAFITASVANEPANMAFCALGLWLAQRYVLQGPASSPLRAVALGLVLGLISLAKMTGLSMGLVIVIAMLYSAISTRKILGAAWLLWRDGLIIGLLFLAVGGWWYWRNYLLYGDFFQRGLYKLYFNVDPQPLSLGDFLFILFSGEVSFWATFGWLNIVAPDWVYLLYRIISRIGLIGVAIMLILQLLHHPLLRTMPYISRTAHHAPRITPLLLHLVFPLTLAFSLTRLVATEGGIQGRQLLPALGSIAIVIMAGWWTLFSARFRPAGIGLLLTLMFGLALWLPYRVVAQAFTPPPLHHEKDIPANLARLNWSYREEMKLVGATIGAEQVKPGDRVPVTLYWQALKPMTTNYSVFVHLIGRDYEVVGQFNSYPGLGLHPTQSLKPGQIVVDTYPALVNGGSQAPGLLQVAVGLFDFKEAGRPGLPAIGADSQEVNSIIGQLKLVPEAWPTPPAGPPLAEFADQIWLGDSQIEGCTSRQKPCLLTLTWLAQGRPSADYTVFVQLWQAGQKVTGFDAPPLANNYPTRWWAAGEVIVDPHPLDLSQLSPGEYQILVGLYLLDTGERLPATAGGAPLPGYALELGSIRVESP
jgi:hypothetical protein